MKRCSRLFPALLVLLCVLLAAACASAAEILPMDFPAPDLNNGEYCILISDEDQIEDSGYFTAELFLEDRYDGDRIRALAKGDTVWMNGCRWTVDEIVLHRTDGDESQMTYEVYPAEEYYGYLVFEPNGDGTFHALIDDWVPVTRVGEVRVTLPLPDRFAFVPVSSGEEEDPVGADGFLEDLWMFGGFIPYNTTCVMENGELVRVTHASYPWGPEDYWPYESEEAAASLPRPVWQFCGGTREGLETAEITGFTTDCEAGRFAIELSEEQKEKIRRMAMDGVVTAKENDTMVTGGTAVYLFESSSGEYLLAVELYEGLLVGRDGMYAYEISPD